VTLPAINKNNAEDKALSFCNNLKKKFVLAGDFAYITFFINRIKLFKKDHCLLSIPVPPSKKIINKTEHFVYP
jgi:hypothetical protein